MKGIVPSDKKVFVAYPATADDEISVGEIFNIVWGCKFFLIGGFIAGILLGVTLCVLLPKEYRAEGIIFAPRESEVSELTVQDIEKLSPAAIFGDFLQNFKSRGLRFSFFQEQGIGNDVKDLYEQNIDEYELFLRVFDQPLRMAPLQGEKKNENGFTKVTLDGRSPDDIAKWLNEYVLFVDKYTVNEHVKDINTQLSVRIKNVQKKIERLRFVALDKQKHRETVIKDAIVIAKKLNISSPAGVIGVSSRIEKDMRGVQGGVWESQQPLYLQGYIALQEVLGQLNRRKEVDSYFGGIRELKGDITFLEKSRLTRNQSHSVSIDQKARVLAEPVKPKRFFLIFCGGVLGLIFGVILAFLRNLCSFFNRERGNVNV